MDECLKIRIFTWILINMKLCQGMINWEIIPVERQQRAKENSDVSEIETSFLSNDDS